MNKKHNIKIFYEKSKMVGHGHFVRSYRLYKILKERGFSSYIYGNKKKEEINNIIEKSKKEIYLILDYKNYKKIDIKKNLKIKKVFIIENLMKKKFYNSLNIFPLDIQFKNYSGSSYFQYPLNFYKIKNKILKFKKVPHILIIQGGTDANNNLNKILSILIKNEFLFNFKIIVKTNKKNQINKNFIKMKEIKIVQKVKSIYNIYKTIDLAISACGNSAFELGYLGVPTIHFTNEKREIKRAKLFEKEKLGVFCYPENKKKTGE